MPLEHIEEEVDHWLHIWLNHFSSQSINDHTSACAFPNHIPNVFSHHLPIQIKYRNKSIFYIWFTHACALRGTYPEQSLLAIAFDDFMVASVVLCAAVASENVKKIDLLRIQFPSPLCSLPFCLPGTNQMKREKHDVRFNFDWSVFTGVTVT